MKDILLILLNVLLNTAAQILMKQGMLKIGRINLTNDFIAVFPKIISSFWVWSSLICYGVSAVIWMVVLSRVQVSYSYPFVALGFVIVAILGYLLFQENITFYRGLGIILICIGIIFVAKS